MCLKVSSLQVGRGVSDDFPTLSLGPDDFPALSLYPDDFLTLSFGPDDLRVCTIKGTKFLSVMMSLPALLDVFSAHHLLAVIAPLLCSRSPLGPTS